MELEIEDKLQEIYKNLKIEVNFKDFRIYENNVQINNENKGFPIFLFSATTNGAIVGMNSLFSIFIPPF